MHKLSIRKSVTTFAPDGENVFECTVEFFNSEKYHLLSRQQKLDFVSSLNGCIETLTFLRDEVTKKILNDENS